MTSQDEKVIKEINDIRTKLEQLYIDIEICAFEITRKIVNNEIERLEKEVEFLEGVLKDMEG